MPRKRRAAKSPRDSKTKHVKEESLSDSHILELSRRIADAEELWDLGIQVLGLPEHEIRSTQTKYHPDINQTAHHLLTTWLRQQVNRQEAYTALLTALRGCQGMQDLAGKLKQWVEGSEVAQGPGLTERLEQLQLLTKQSLRTKPFCLAIGKDWTLKPNKTDLREIFTDLSWTRKHRKAYTVEREDLKNITQILNEEQLGEDGPVRILVQAGGGMGKSTAMKHLAISWADGTSEELKKFDFVFHISLKMVRDNSPIENIIIAQHVGLKANGVKSEEINVILNGKSRSKTLLLIDGHDEYKSGTNTDIDEAIRKEKLWNCWIILTSRETTQLGDVKQYMDAEAEIRGFDSTNIKTYVSRSLGGEMKAEELLDQIEQAGLMVFSEGIMAIPILLHMICVLFMCNLSLPKTKTGIIQAIVNRCVDREAIRAKGQKAVDRTNQVLYNLGKLAWQGLNEAGKKLYFSKEEVVRVAGEEALELGLLFGTENLTPQEEETDVLCFAHLLIQEFVGAFFVSKFDMTTLENIFPDKASILNHREVVKFACCLSEKPDFLIEIICDRFAAQARQNPTNDYDYDTTDYDILKELTTELSTTTFTVHPLHNRFLNYFNFYDDEDEKTVFVPSKIFKGKGMFSQPHVLLFPDDNTRASGTNKASETETADSGQLGASPEKNKTGDSSDGRKARHTGKGEQVEGCLIHGHYQRHRYGFQEMVIALKMLSRIKERASVCVRKIDMCCLQLTENSASCDERHFTCNIDLSLFEELQPTMELVKEISTCQKLDVHQLELRNMNFKDKCEMEKLVLEILRMPSFQHVRSVTMIGGLAQLMWNELCQLLPHLSELEELNLQNKVIENGLSKDDVQNLLSNLGQCRKITTVNLSHTTLTDCVQTLLSCELENLKRLILKRTCLSKNDVDQLFQAVSYNKFPDLMELNVSGNTLEGCFHHLVKGSGIGLQSLDVFNLKNTSLGDSDISGLVTLIKLGQLPNLKTLILTGEVLTEVIADILSDSSHQGFTSLETLRIQDAQLSGNDVKSLTNAMKAGRLPNLKSIRLGLDAEADERDNMEVEEFVETCVKYVKHGMFIKILGKQLSYDSCRKMTSFCAGTPVHLIVKTRAQRILMLHGTKAYYKYNSYTDSRVSCKGWDSDDSDRHDDNENSCGTFTR